jgi:hypothetical protein
MLLIAWDDCIYLICFASHYFLLHRIYNFQIITFLHFFLYAVFFESISNQSIIYLTKLNNSMYIHCPLIFIYYVQLFNINQNYLNIFKKIFQILTSNERKRQTNIDSFYLNLVIRYFCYNSFLLLYILINKYSLKILNSVSQFSHLTKSCFTRLKYLLQRCSPVIPYYNLGYWVKTLVPLSVNAKPFTKKMIKKNFYLLMF